MKRYSSLLILFSFMLVIVCASASYAIFPGQTFGLGSGVGDGYLDIQLEHGWAQGADVWHHCFSTNNIRWAQTEDITLVAKLSSGVLPFGSSTMFVFTNFNNSGPVFTGTPINGVYSSTWEVFFVKWRSTVTPWVVTDSLATAGAPPGLPLAGTQADYSLSPPGSPPGTPVIVDCTIFAVGPIGNPWRRLTHASPPFIYRIPQATRVNTYTKQLTIPYWNVYCQNPTTRKIHVERVVIPDAHPASLASLIGANLAPVLLAFPTADRQLFQVINWAQDIDPITPGIQPLKVLANQYPVICDCPTELSWRNTNLDYSPVTQFTLLNRVSPFSPEVLFSNCPFIEAQVAAGNLLSVLWPTPPLPAPPTPVGYPPAGLGTLFVLHSPVVTD